MVGIFYLVFALHSGW